MAPINIYADPLPKAEIQRMRKALGTATDAGLTAMWFAPPILDMAFGAVAAGIDHLRNGDKREALEDDTPATSRDWSATDATAHYVEKVRAMGRPLVKAEVSALENHLAIAGVARTFVNSAIRTVSDAASSLGAPKTPKP